MCVESVNGKKYILFIVDDYSRFTWVKCLSSKDESPYFIIKFLKMIQVRLKVLVRRIRTDNRAEFVNQTMREYYEQVSISHETSVALSPHQNGVVERQAVATTCFTQNRSIIRLRHGKTPYELLHDKLPDLLFFHVFGALCYLTNDSENLEKLQPKANIGLVPNPTSSTPFVQPSRTNWDMLFQPLFDELLTPPPSVDHPALEVIALIAKVVAPKPAASTDSIHTIMHPDHQVSKHNSKWTKDRPLENIIGQLDRPVSTRLQLREQAFFCYYDAFLTSVEPKTYKDALTQSCWIEWIYKVKLDELGGILKNKAWLVARGYRQEEPDGFVDPDNPNHVYKLKKALYGLKQAPRAWYDMLSSFLISQDFSKGSVDPTMFIHRDSKELLLVQIYVDDIIFAASTPELCDLFAKIMCSKFKMSMMGKILFFLGQQISQRPRGIFINQSKYALEPLKKYGFKSCDPVDTPMVEKSKLDEDKEWKVVDPSHYRGMIGTLLYLTDSRPDLQFVICMCARYQARPTEKHLHAVKRIFRYLRGTVNRGLWYPKDSLIALTAFADANHAGCQDTCRSTSGSMQFLGDRLISWLSKRQKSATISSTEAEYIALSGCYAQILWMRLQLTDYGLGFNNILSTVITKAPLPYAAIMSNILEYQLVDIFAKALGRERIEFLINKLGMRSFTSETLQQLTDEVDE
nr:hypothetical protein [Tanacetum cinerariifolium]